MTASSLTLDHKVISKIVEISNIHGMSVKKFKRIMKILVTDFFLFNQFHFIHNVEIGLHTHDGFKKQLNEPIVENLKYNFAKYNEKEIKDYMLQIGIPAYPDKIDYIPILIEEIK